MTPHGRNLLILTTAQAIGAAGAPIIIAVGGLVGAALAPTPFLATLPVSMFTVGVALGTLPVAYLVRRFGRRETYLTAATVAVFGGLLATAGILLSSFLLFCAGATIAGLYGASVQSYRFAATEGLPPEKRAAAVSTIMIGGLVAAIIGPQITIFTLGAISGQPYAGPFLAQAMLAAGAVAMLLLLRPPPVVPESDSPAAPARPWREVFNNPRLLLAMGTGIVSYSLMSFMMTSAPLAMIACGLTVSDATLGIQWHVLAMFAPSFLTGRLISRFGVLQVSCVGLALIAAAAVCALAGLTVYNFWVALVLLGVGWNFSFIGATTMVAQSYRPEDASLVQGINDFAVFGSVALASLGSGALISLAGWEVISWALLAIATAGVGVLLVAWMRGAFVAVRSPSPS